MNTSRRKDLKGKIFGKLTVLGYSHTHKSPGGQGHAMWNVRCSCGTQKAVSGGNLTRGVKSCGCLKKEGLNKKPFGEASANSRFAQYKTSFRNRKKHLTFELTKEQFLSIVVKPCVYCGTVNSNEHHATNCNGSFVSNGIDRVDSNIGYTIENCVPCCDVCNRMKLDHSVDVFLGHIEKIFNHLRKV